MRPTLNPDDAEGKPFWRGNAFRPRRMVAGRSEAGRRAGGDDLGLLGADVAATVRQPAAEIVGIAGPHHPATIADRHLHAAPLDDPAFLGRVPHLAQPGFAAGAAALLAHLTRQAGQVASNLEALEPAATRPDQQDTRIHD